MNVSPNNDKIEKYLDELSEEYKELLFKALVEKSKSLDDLSVSELLRIDSEVKKTLFKDYQRQKKRSRLFLMVGLTYLFVGFFLLIIYKLGDQGNLLSSIDIIPLMSIVISFVGFILATLSTLKLSSQKLNFDSKKDSAALIEYEVIAKWRDLEGITNDISVDNGKHNNPRSIIGYLFDNQLIDNKEFEALKEFLKMRNDIVHSTGVTYSTDHIQDTLNYVNQVLKKLSKLV